mgnify:FL=1
MKERDKRLTEAMGLCSHDYKAYGQHSHHYIDLESLDEFRRADNNKPL